MAKQRVARAAAMVVAEQWMGLLGPACERIGVGGSLRRGLAWVGDVELVAVPRMEVQLDLFGLPVGEWSALDVRLRDLGVKLVKDGDRYKQFEAGEGLMVDLFVQPDPATWGVNFMIRTGSADFARWMVTPRSVGGAMMGGMRCEGARLWFEDVVLGTPEEVDVFAAMELDWILPEARERGRWGRFA